MASPCWLGQHESQAIEPSTHVNSCAGAAGDGKYCLAAGQDRTIRLYNPHRLDPDKEGKTRVAGQLEEGLLVKAYAGPHG